MFKFQYPHNGRQIAAQYSRVPQSEQRRRALFCCRDAVLSVFTILLALRLTAGTTPSLAELPGATAMAVLCLLLTRLALFSAFGIYDVSPDPTGTRNLKRLIAATTVASALCVGWNVLRPVPVLPLTTLCIDWAFNLLAVSGIRLRSNHSLQPLR
jgi:FlaA1/EpsC-like NDP-sugar epimerase